MTKLDNGQLEVDVPEGTPAPAATPRVVTGEASAAEPAAPAPATAEERPNGRRRGRRGGRGRGPEREGREPRAAREMTTTAETPVPVAPVPAPTVSTPVVDRHAVTPPMSRPAVSDMQLELGGETKAATDASAGAGGDRLTRAEAFDLLRRTVEDLVRDDESVRASAVRTRARQLLGRDSESLSDRMFVRILKDAHDDGIIDLRRHGNDFEVARAVPAGSVADQLATHEQAAIKKTQPPTTSLPGPRLGMGPRGAGAGRRGSGDARAARRGAAAGIARRRRRRRAGAASGRRARRKRDERWSFRAARQAHAWQSRRDQDRREASGVESPGQTASAREKGNVVARRMTSGA